MILENNLIKRYSPFFNIDLKDNKTYPYLWLTTHETFPQLIKTRYKGPQGSYFGPYPNVYLVDQYIKLFNLLYPLKKCSRKKFPPNFKPCFYFDIGQCLDYCAGKVTKEKIASITKEIKELLGNNKKSLLKKINAHINDAVVKQNYEKAKLLKESLTLIEDYDNQQSVEWLSEDDFDVIDFNCWEMILIVTILKFRNGKLINKESYKINGRMLFFKEDLSTNLQEALKQYLFEYYQKTYDRVKKIYLSDSFLKEKFFLEIEKTIQIAFSLNFPQINNHLLKVKVPLKGNKTHLIELAKSNSNYKLAEEKLKMKEEEVLGELQKLLTLPKKPKLIESFDIANTADQGIMGGMVCFVNGKKHKSDYRLFNIKTTAKQDDFKSMEEVIHRRYSRQLKERKKLPDLILIDGGKGQLNAALKSLHQLELSKVPVISLSKKKETIFVPNLKEGLNLPFSHPCLRFIISLRDETHRFINYQHSKKRSKINLKSSLLNIKNFGKVKVNKLLSTIEDFNEIANCSLEEVKKITKLKEKDAAALMKHLKFNLKNDVEN